ncbi:hypothetical protein [Thiomicrorhabdus aquaedulcis]|uniref:hypothetical protein n=1 Tax=Thiomicrorhabdus aquaedulcis TaxID=2211106 RepID=UPI000FD76596|nr:hypothetical protein [Thiomicrorhabdus aquaedulcis]
MNVLHVLSGLIIGLLVGCAQAPSQNRTLIGVATPSVAASVLFTHTDRNTITQYYRHHPGMRGHKPSHAKQGHAPHTKYLLHQPLPPHVVYNRFPYELERSMPRLPADYVRIIIGGDVFIMNARTRILYDAIWGVY